MIGYIIAISTTLQVDPALLYSICKVESNLTNVINLKDNGSPSYGICQVKLNTANYMIPGIKKADLMVPEVNFIVAALYLKYHLGKQKGNVKRSISAYNAGRPIKGNRRYVDKVMKNMIEFRKLKLILPEPKLARR